MEIRILLAAPDASRGEMFKSEIERLGGHCTAVYSLTEIYQEMTRKSYHGLLIEKTVAAHANQDEKALIHDLLGRMPVLRVASDEETGGIRSLLYGSSRPVPLPDCLREYCHPEAAVSARSDMRLPLHLNALIAADLKGLRKAPERTVTLNVSSGGCFLMTTRDWSGKSRLWLELIDLADSEPVEVEICWRIPWGMSLRLPGVGVRFLTVSEAQKKEMEELLRRRPWCSEPR